MNASVFTGVRVMGIFVVVILLVSSFFAFGDLLSRFFSLLARNKKPKPEFDYIDNRNETRYLRNHYPNDKR